MAIDVKNTKEALDLVLALYKAGDGALADGKLGFDDLAQLMAVVPKIGPAVADMGKIPQEFADLDSAEAAELVAHVAAGLALQDEKAKDVLDAALKVLVAGYGLFVAIKK